MSSVTIDNLIYSLSGTNATVTGYSNPPSSWNLVIPRTIINQGTTYNVVDIQSSIFINVQSLERVTIDASVSIIRNSTFQDCSNLLEVTLPNTVQTINAGVFLRCTSLVGINMRNSVVTISNYAFQNCTSLVNITLSSALKTIGIGAFAGCTSLQSITIPSLVENISNEAFSGCIGLQTVTYNNNSLSSSINFSISDNTFNSCTSLTSVTLPSSLKTTGTACFYNCTSLASITLPNSLITIGIGSFQNCTSLTSITIPNSVTTVSTNAFYNCTNLTSVTLSNTLTQLSPSCFYNCTSLPSIIIPNSVTTISGGCFQNCTSLTNVLFLGNIPTIASPNFNITGDTGMFVPDASNVNTLSSFFTNVNVLVNGVKYSLSGTTATITGNFNSPTIWNLTIPDSINHLGTNYIISSIPDYAFYAKINLKSVIIGNNVTSIGSNAFRSTDISSVIIGNNVTSIGSEAFRSCTYLTSINIPSELVTITNGMLRESGIRSITIPNKVTTIEGSAFRFCNYLSSITIGNSVTTIGSYAFQNCIVSSISIPSSVSFIDIGAFGGCANLLNVEFLGNVLPSIGANNFTAVGDTAVYNYAVTNPNILSQYFTYIVSNVPVYPICFPAGTPVETDQGTISIEKINCDKNTIRGKKIVAVTKTITIENKIVCIEKNAFGTNIPSQNTYISRNHAVLYNKKMIKAKHLIGQVTGVYNKKYNGEILYNVLLETHDKMLVNNLIVETLDPLNIIAQIYNKSCSKEDKNQIIININKCANNYKKVFGKLL